MAIPDNDVKKLYQEIAELRKKVDAMADEHKAVVKAVIALKPILDIIKNFSI